MSILDELKKKKIEGGYINLEHVRLSDIEEVLSKATCENCKYLFPLVDNPREHLFFCTCDGNPVGAMKYQKATFCCNQWESKEVKNGTLQ